MGYILVPENLACRIPDGVTWDEAAFAMLGVIALHGVRSAELAFGSKVAVIGLGLLGLLTVQLLKAYGCVVLGMDPAERKVALAQEFGAVLARQQEKTRHLLTLHQKETQSEEKVYDRMVTEIPPVLWHEGVGLAGSAAVRAPRPFPLRGSRGEDTVIG